MTTEQPSTCTHLDWVPLLTTSWLTFYTPSTTDGSTTARVDPDGVIPESNEAKTKRASDRYVMRSTGKSLDDSRPPALLGRYNLFASLVHSAARCGGCGRRLRPGGGQC